MLPITNSKYFTKCYRNDTSFNYLQHCIKTEHFVDSRNNYDKYINAIHHSKFYFDELIDKMIKLGERLKIIELFEFNNTSLKTHDNVGDIDMNLVSHYIKSQDFSEGISNVYKEHYMKSRHNGDTVNNEFGYGVYRGYYLCVNRKNDNYKVFLSDKDCEKID